MENERDAAVGLTDLLDVEMLQKFQDAFARMTGMAALITDESGKPVTKGSNFTDFCMKYTRKSPVGCQRCEWCDMFGAQQTLESGRAETYFCHAGLIDYAAPILLGNRQIGCAIGGQVLTTRPTDERIRQIAADLGVDPEAYVEAARQVKILPKDMITRTAAFLQEVASFLSELAYSKYMTEKVNREVMQVDRMKSDFLANMSHEIRTPMNAVIGMAEMAMREELPQAARNYIAQIKTSGRELLRIINDILDFSKIESGKMDIVPVEYESMSIINDVVTMVMTRLKDKDVELILDLDPQIPAMLYGDNIRIKQVLTNIANNAVKYTNEGKITIRAEFERTDEKTALMKISVTDTGIGIKKQDLDKLFQSFQQLDSKRNRNVEGTGLGLAITKQLLHLMGGDIQVESEYGKGSTFSFCYPQEIVQDDPSITVADADTKAVLGWIDSEYIVEQLRTDCARLGVDYVEAPSREALSEYVRLHPEKEFFFFLDRALYTEDWDGFARQHPEIRIVLLTDFFDSEKYSLADISVIKKPVYVLNLAQLLKNEDFSYAVSEEGEEDFDYIAPEAEILVVDDNAVNLTVVEGLLAPLKIRIQTALSGKEAIEKISSQKFDLIFMDHMMPEMDGVETTRIIRRFHTEYNEVPIIALTANAVDGTKEMFLSEGMNDFVPKPIELRTLISKVREWLPVEKIQKAEREQLPEEEQAAEEEIVVGDLDTKAAIGLLGSAHLFWTILETYYQSIEKKAELIKEMEQKEDWAGYTIEVHSLKSFSRQIGAAALADEAAELERAGNARETKKIHDRTDALLTHYRSYLPVLEPFFHKEEIAEEDKEELTEDAMRALFDRMRQAIDDLDMDLMEEIVDQMNHSRYPEAHRELLERLKAAAAKMDTATCEELLEAWEG